MRRSATLFLLAAGLAASTFAQMADLTGLKFCIDPGHGGHNPANDRYLVPDPGVEFWESESNFQKALLLKTLLEVKGAAVILTRYTNDYPDDNLEPSLSARVALANANNVDWFHSIHSNAVGNGFQTSTAINYTLMLVREKRSLTDPAASTGVGLGVPEQEDSWTVSTIMSPTIKTFLRTPGSSRTYLDWTFYGGVNGGFSLGVLRGLLMPGELSEGSMHDYAPETRRLLNNSYRKMETYALRNSFLQFFGVPADTMSIIAGIQTDVATQAPLNYTQVRMLPENRVYTGDTFNNGFYMFDSLQPGLHTVRFETPGLFGDSVDLFLSAGSLTFVDRSLESTAFPVVVSSNPVNGDTAFAPNAAVTLRFSKPMDTASVRSAFSISPAVSGRISWAPSLTEMVFAPDSALPFLVTYTLTLDTTARSDRGQAIDGNADGTPGDPYSLTFRTRVADLVPPHIVFRYPDNGAVTPTSNQVINVTFDEPLKPSTVIPTNFGIRIAGGSALARSIEYTEVGERSGVTIYPASPFVPGTSYQTVVNAVQDLAGNPIAGPVFWTFALSPDLFQFRTLDSLNLSLDNWYAPGASGSTTGIDSASFAPAPLRTIPVVQNNPASAELRYSWQTGAPDYLIREYLSGGLPRNTLFRKERTVLQVYLFGDGSGTEFRFAVDDSVDGFPAGTADHHEVSRWIPVDWVGWRCVEWDLEHDSVGTWIGNGVLEGQLRFDSFQLRKTATSASRGVLAFDQLQLAEKIVVGVDEGPQGLPTALGLSQNYPNPFNPSTTIRWQIAETGWVTLTVYDVLGREVGRLVNEKLEPGRYGATFDGSGLASGMYVYRLTAGGQTVVRKMLLAK